LNTTLEIDDVLPMSHHYGNDSDLSGTDEEDNVELRPIVFNEKQSKNFSENSCRQNMK